MGKIQAMGAGLPAVLHSFRSTYMAKPLQFFTSPGILHINGCLLSEKAGAYKGIADRCIRDHFELYRPAQPFPYGLSWRSLDGHHSHRFSAAAPQVVTAEAMNAY